MASFDQIKYRKEMGHMFKILSLATFVLAGAGLFMEIHKILATFICVPHPPAAPFA